MGTTLNFLRHRRVRSSSGADNSCCTCLVVDTAHIFFFGQGHLGETESTQCHYHNDPSVSWDHWSSKIGRSVFAISVTNMTIVQSIQCFWIWKDHQSTSVSSSFCWLELPNQTMIGHTVTDVDLLTVGFPWFSSTVWPLLFNKIVEDQPSRTFNSPWISCTPIFPAQLPTSKAPCEGAVF